jgi:hypothetical protein
MTRSRVDKRDTLSDEVRRQFGSAGMSRFLRALPLFRIDLRMPDQFQNLLAELDRVETAGSSDRRRER